MTMTKTDLVGIMCERMNFTLKESNKMIEQVFDIIKGTLEGGENIKISGFGNFIVRQKRARKGRNPRTGEEAVITGRTVVTFKASDVLRRAIDKSVEEGDVGSG